MVAPAWALPGDLNGNGHVDLQDAQVALKIASGQTAATSTSRDTGDVAGPAGNTPDGRVTILDALRIARAANGLDDLGGGSPSALMVAKNDTVTVSGATTKNIQLPPGYALTGTVKDTHGNSITTAPGLKSASGSISFTNAANSAATGYGSVAGDATFSAVVAAGTNSASVTTAVTSFDQTTFEFTSYSVVQTPTPSSLVVNGATTQAFVRPDLPVPGQLAGTITSPDVSVNTLSFALTDGGGGYGFPTDDTYSITAPPGSGNVTMSGELAADSEVTVGSFGLGGTKTVASGATTTYNIVVPSVNTFHGTVTLPSGVTLDGALATNGTVILLNGYYSSYDASSTPGAYKLALPAGASTVLLTMKDLTIGDATLTWGYTFAYTVPTGDSTKNVSLPALPATFTLQGTITGPDGKPVANADVNAYQSDAASAGWHATADTTTGADGKYSRTVPAGTFSLYVTPPSP
jgi:hypothetical protein